MRTRQILCPTDFSETASHALGYAIEMATLYGVDLRIVHVVSEPYGAHNYGIVVESNEELEQHLHAYANGKLGEIVRDAQIRMPPHLKVRSEVRTGGVLGQILLDAEENDVGMIVVASHGHTGLAHLLNPSVAEELANKAKCPVMVVK
ncbi:universal stress protein [Shewanella loihica]|uniref:UspA domain protein n=1 Tax=Shewanella loihica (strain ATCC BAA-1088 / PV-4) TaxID=323850 RepID=A3QHL8_SHELP|nr:MULTISPECIES: universal stress protein [Shewanella]ABO24966.1 UspA domain protein [Shewanella loihica PV-4]QYJ90784.1 universal stress protein [Shewanella halotolerans]QYK12238.1 universal stress protein [Shewanella rhizosphaerae]